MTPEFLTIELLSDTSFVAGRGTVGDVDIDVELEPCGLPRVGGKTLHGLLFGSWLQMAPVCSDLLPAADRLYGTGANFESTALLRLADATVDEETRLWVDWALRRAQNPLRHSQVRDAVTAIRSQSSEDSDTGAPKEGSLRRSRVLIRGLILRAPLDWSAPPNNEDLRCLSLSALACRHGGLHRRRGRGLLRVLLNGDRDATLQLAQLEPSL